MSSDSNRGWTPLERAYFHIGLFTGMFSGAAITGLLWWLG